MTTHFIDHLMNADVSNICISKDLDIVQKNSIIVWICKKLECIFDFFSVRKVVEKVKDYFSNENVLKDCKDRRGLKDRLTVLQMRMGKNRPEYLACFQKIIDRIPSDIPEEEQKKMNRLVDFSGLSTDRAVEKYEAFFTDEEAVTLNRSEMEDWDSRRWGFEAKATLQRLTRERIAQYSDEVLKSVFGEKRLERLKKGLGFISVSEVLFCKAQALRNHFVKKYSAEIVKAVEENITMSEYLIAYNKNVYAVVDNHCKAKLSLG